MASVPTEPSNFSKAAAVSLAKKRATRAKLGTGTRFKALRSQLAQQPNVTDPNALAAAIGRKKLGARKFNNLAAKGK